MLKLIRFLIVVLAIILGLVFAYMNRQKVHVDLLFTGVDTALIILLVATFIAGFIIAVIGGFYRATKLRVSLAKARKEIKRLENTKK